MRHDEDNVLQEVIDVNVKLQAIFQQQQIIVALLTRILAALTRSPAKLVFSLGKPINK